MLQSKSIAMGYIREAESIRLQAIHNDEVIEWRPVVTPCDAEEKPLFRFFADGTASGPDICLLDIRLRLHPLTGLLLELQG